MSDRDWYSPQDCNRFWAEHCRFLIRHITELRDGRWVPNPEGTGYVDTGLGHRQVKAKAGFCSPIEFAAEITNRLEKCGVDGLMTEAYYGWDVTEESLAKFYGTDEYDIRRRIKRVIRYISSKMRGQYRHRWYLEIGRNLPKSQVKNG